MRTQSTLHILLLAALATCTASGCATDRQVIRQADDTHLQLDPAVVEEAELAGYLKQVGQRVVDVARSRSAQGYGPKSHFKDDTNWMFGDGLGFHFVNSETLNAFTTGGKHMYIYTKLMQTCRSEDELAAVVAHEYGHIYARHVHKGMNRQYGAIGGALVGGVIGYAAADDDQRWETAAGAAGLAYAGMSFLNMGFTRDDEAEADALGFEFYARAGWDPAQFAGFFEQLIAMGHDTTPEMLSDHPTLASRVAGAKQRAAALPPEAAAWRQAPVADAARFKALQQKAALLASTMPRDDSLAVAQTLLAAVPSCLLPEDQPEQKAAQARIRRAVERNEQPQP